MTAIRLAALALIASAAAAHAQSQQPAQQPFQGIEGEVTAPAQETAPFLSNVQSLSFDIGRASPTEQSIITERAGARSDFFRSTIHSGRRAGATGGTGLTIFDKLFDLD